jgi:hypothetical protein
MLLIINGFIYFVWEHSCCKNRIPIPLCEGQFGGAMVNYKKSAPALLFTLLIAACGQTSFKSGDQTPVDPEKPAVAGAAEDATVKEVKAQVAAPKPGKVAANSGDVKWKPMVVYELRQPTDSPLRTGYFFIAIEAENLLASEKIASFAPQAVSTDMRLHKCGLVGRKANATGSWQEVFGCLLSFTAVSHPDGPVHRVYDSIPLSAKTVSKDAGARAPSSKEIDLTICIRPEVSPDGCEDKAGRVVIKGITPDNTAKGLSPQMKLFGFADGTLAADLEQQWAAGVVTAKKASGIP